MNTKSMPAPVPGRYVWDAAVGSADIDCRLFDPSGITNKSQRRGRPAIGFIAGSTGSVVYTDSSGQICYLKVATAGVYYPADIAILMKAGAPVPIDTGSATASKTPTAFAIMLFWEL